MRSDKTSGPVTLEDLREALAQQQCVALIGGNVAVDDLHMDSRAVTPSCLYAAIRGANADGHDFIPAAIAAGAVAVAAEQTPPVDIPHLLVADTRLALGLMAAEIHHHPARQLGVIGVTGTNGKTTVAHMVAAMTEDTSRRTAVIGTVSSRLVADDVSPRTTPEASDVHRILRHLVDGGEITDVAIEVSSHAMVMGRVNGIEFDLVAFTNLSRDHLDFHYTMEDYYRAKAGLFRPERAPHGVIWVDDPWGRRLVDDSEIPVTTVGSDPAADVVVTYGRETPRGTTFTIRIDGRPMAVQTSLAGRFNAANAAIALACAHRRGWDIDHAVAQLAAMAPIPGRYNTVDAGQDFWVVVDYAHTPDAIASVIAETRLLATGRTIVVVGAGGDRDRDKRPLMGQAAATADVTIITTDNPRSEDPAAIAHQVIAAIPPDARLVVEPDRRLAIRHALGLAASGDAVLILGKGHETGQEFADRIAPFDDRAVAVEELSWRSEVER